MADQVPAQHRPAGADPAGIFISSVYGTGAGMVQVSGGQPRIAWQDAALQQHVGSPVLLGDGFLYGIHAHSHRPGELYCVDPAAGAVRWRQAGFGMGALSAAGDRLLVLRGRGELVLVQADPAGYRELARAQVLRGECVQPPAIAAGRAYVQGVASGEVACFDLVGG